MTRCALWSEYPRSTSRPRKKQAGLPQVALRFTSVAAMAADGPKKDFVLALPNPKALVTDWFQEVGTKVTGFFQNGQGADNAKDRCARLAKAHESDAPWVTPLELYEKLEVAGSAVDRAQGAQYVLEQQPFIGWRNLGAQSLTKTFFYSPTETSDQAPQVQMMSVNAPEGPTTSTPEWWPLAGTDAPVMLYIIRPPPPMVAPRRRNS